LNLQNLMVSKQDAPVPSEPAAAEGKGKPAATPGETKAAGLAKILPAPEMEKLMVTHIEVKEDDLRLLASQRALNVRAALLVSGEVTPDRVFLIETKALLPPSKEKIKNSRVDFRLK
jgi:hypothetical protein